MNNQDSAAQLTIPIIPDTVCFQGTNTQILNQAFQQYLANATINIPGLGDVTPAEIAQINATLIQLQNEIDALPVENRSGTQAIATGDNNYTITFGTNMPNANYSVGVEFVATVGNATTSFGWSLVGGKNASGFTVRCYDIPSDIASFNWSARQLS
jgi:hypothetical protein